MSKKIILPSGKVLEIWLSPFAVSKVLYQAVLEEGKALKVNAGDDIDINTWKDLFCAGFTSQKIDEALAECMKKVTYGGVKINEDTFEPVEARGDYMMVCFEVAKENISPFLKSLYAKFSPILDQIKKSPV